MITGFNTDVDYAGRVYHVQTEDKGLKNPIIESLVYSGGEIITSVKSGYEELVPQGEEAETEVLRRMEVQHQNLIRDIRNGRFDPEGPKPFGYNIISNKSLDEVVLDYLVEQPGLRHMRIEMENAPTLVFGESPVLHLRVVDEETDRPVSAANVVVKLISTEHKPKQLESGATDPDGRLSTSIELPDEDVGECAVVCQAEIDGHNCEIKRYIKRPEEAR